MQTIHLIAALDAQQAIGVRDTNRLPWHLPGDLRHFRTLTEGHVVVMGRRTYESIGKALPKRTNIVLTRNAQFKAPGCLCMSSVEQVLQWVRRELAHDDNRIMFVIGGSAVYAAFLPHANTMHLTRVQRHNTGGDVFFPPVDWSQWQRVSVLSNVDKMRRIHYTFETWQRK